MAYRIGIDVGGTFTDLVLVRPNGELVVEKSSTTPQDQSLGVMSGLTRLAERDSVSLRELPEQTHTIVHGTTIADNTMIEMNGAVTGLITTQGHRDEIELRRGFKEDIWNPALPPPIPIAPRRRRIGVPERLDFEGNVVTALDEEAVRSAFRRLKELGTESLAVVFMFSFVNPAHELRVRKIGTEECPDLPVWLSHEIMPSAPEFERTSTTLVNAFVGPRIRRYLERLVRRLREAGYTKELLVMQSNGGVMTTDYILKRPITILSSGPTGGVTAACATAAQSTLPAHSRSTRKSPTGKAPLTEFVCADMGGTSYDVCLIRNGHPEVKAGWNWHHRYVIGLPMVDIPAIGAGGGSIASVTAGSLQVGPRSAGADPGPICYGRGGAEVTVTDANAVLGYLNPDDFCSGTMRLDVGTASRAIREQIAHPLGLSIEKAAFGIYRLVNATMANAIRRVTAHHGTDPRTLTMIAYGGNGPVHATPQAEELGIRTVLIPKLAPAFSALGLLLADHVIDDMRSCISPVNQVDPKQIESLFHAMTQAAEAEMQQRKGLHVRVTRKRFLHLSYPGQTFDMAVPFAGKKDRVIQRDIEATVRSFHDLHERFHTYAARDEVPVLRGVRLTTIGVTKKPALPTISASRSRPDVKGRRLAYFGGRFLRVPVYNGPLLRAGQEIRGPAIVEEPFTTIVLHPRQRAKLTPNGCYLVTLP